MWKFKSKWPPSKITDWCRSNGKERKKFSVATASFRYKLGFLQQPFCDLCKSALSDISISEYSILLLWRVWRTYLNLNFTVHEMILLYCSSLQLHYKSHIFSPALLCSPSFSVQFPWTYKSISSQLLETLIVSGFLHNYPFHHKSLIAHIRMSSQEAVLSYKN